MLFYYFALDRGANYCDQHVCYLFVCLLRNPKSTMSKFYQIFCTSPVAVAGAYSDGNAVITCTCVDDIVFSHNGANGPESKTTCMFCPVCCSLPSPECILFSLPSRSVPAFTKGDRYWKIVYV